MGSVSVVYCVRVLRVCMLFVILILFLCGISFFPLSCSSFITLVHNYSSHIQTHIWNTPHTPHKRLIQAHTPLLPSIWIVCLYMAVHTPSEKLLALPHHPVRIASLLYYTTTCSTQYVPTLASYNLSY